PFHGDVPGCSPEFNRSAFSMRMRTDDLGRKTSIAHPIGDGLGSNETEARAIATACGTRQHTNESTAFLSQQAGARNGSTNFYDCYAAAPSATGGDVLPYRSSECNILAPLP